MAKRQANWIKCGGEAHRNPHIDNCGSCMPHWGQYPVCPSCGERLRTKSPSAKQVVHCGRVYEIRRSVELQPGARAGVS